MSGHARWYPLRLSAFARPTVFGGRALAREWGRGGLPDWPIGETWEVSDVDGHVGVVGNGPLTGRTLRELVDEHPDTLVGEGWRGRRFPILTKFIDAAGTLPVHLHADDETARRLEKQPNGKTEAWHILRAAPGATALCGVRAGVDRDTLHEALRSQDFDAVLRRLPVRAGETIYVPGGTVHSFGPDTLVYEIEQTSDVVRHAMRWRLSDGAAIPDEEWHANLAALLSQVSLVSRPAFQPGLRLSLGGGAERVLLCAGPYFALERWTTDASTPLHRPFRTAQILSNVGAPVRVTAGAWDAPLPTAETLLLPAALGEVELTGPADVLFGYLPDLTADVLDPLRAAGYTWDLIATLGPGLPTTSSHPPPRR